jgi:hypothetical protein
MAGGESKYSKTEKLMERDMYDLIEYVRMLTD